MKKNLRFILFILVVLIQISVPLYMIFSNIVTLKNGEEIKFKTIPIDPYDPFRGRYLSLDIQSNNVTVADSTQFKQNQPIYAIVDKSNDGYGYIKTISATRPKSGLYFKTRIAYININTIHLNIPFNRYYMNESAAPEAEKIYNERLSNSNTSVYITVKIYKGKSVLDKLFIDGKPIEDILSAKT